MTVEAIEKDHSRKATDVVDDIQRSAIMQSCRARMQRIATNQAWLASYC